MISGGLSLSYKAYLVFMAKYAEEFVKSNIPEMKLTLHQYFFFQFAMNFCWTTPKKYAEIFNLTGIDDKLRILIPMRTNYRMSRDFVCAKDSVLGTPTKCLVI
ncbi:neprilysin-like [Haemaphysalis longicornis]